MKFDRSNKFDFCYYGQVNSLRLKSSVASKWASEHLGGGGTIYFAGDGTSSWWCYHYACKSANWRDQNPGACCPTTTITPTDAVGATNLGFASLYRPHRVPRKNGRTPWTSSWGRGARRRSSLWGWKGFPPIAASWNRVPAGEQRALESHQWQF